MALSFYFFSNWRLIVVIILKYGSVKQMNKKHPRRKYKCSNCGCKVLLDEDDFKVIKVLWRDEKEENDGNE